MKLSRQKMSEAYAALLRLKKGDTWTPRNILLAVLAVLYVLSPFDVLPDWLPLVGWLDDIGVLGGLVCILTNCFGKKSSSSELTQKKDGDS
ncbi:MAG: DUF1232 domain-containing protein [Akkermansia sp.]|nr:DUF1232 domain-containing protein [Akkermansia sp.]